MLGFEGQKKRKYPWKLIGRCVASFISVCFTQFALYLVSHFFSSSLLPLLPLSVMALLGTAGIGKCCKMLIGFRTSAPAFVFMNILFIWCVYIVVVRQAVSSLMDIVFNAALIMLMIGLCSMLSSDPGFVTYEPLHVEKVVSNPFSKVEAPSKELEPSTCGMHQEFPSEESLVPVQRVRYCKHCEAYVKGFDHHCPGFGNCIGQNNHVLFVILLVGFVICEASYIACSSQIARSHIQEITGRETSWSEILASSTMIFSVLQVLWQLVFLTWHIYCVCFNIKTHEWINWKRYPEFQLIVVVPPQPGQPVTETRFTNPYDKGILRNLKEFVEAKG